MRVFFPHQIRDGTKNPIACWMPVGVVNSLKKVEIDDHEREVAAVANRAFPFVVKHLPKASLGTQSGESIRIGQQAKPLFHVKHSGRRHVAELKILLD